jgi:hypothetical protein
MEALYSASGVEFGSTWRNALTGGYFMYNLKSLPSEAQSLYLVFRSDDKNDRTFDLLVDGHIVKTFNHNQPVEQVSTPLYSVIIPIPETLTEDKTNITVKLQAKLNNTTAGLFGIRLIRATDTAELISNKPL